MQRRHVYVRDQELKAIWDFRTWAVCRKFIISKKKKKKLTFDFDNKIWKGCSLKVVRDKEPNWDATHTGVSVIYNVPRFKDAVWFFLALSSSLFLLGFLNVIIFFSKLKVNTLDDRLLYSVWLLVPPSPVPLFGMNMITVHYSAKVFTAVFLKAFLRMSFSRLPAKERKNTMEHDQSWLFLSEALFWTWPKQRGIKRQPTVQRRASECLSGSLENFFSDKGTRKLVWKSHGLMRSKQILTLKLIKMIQTVFVL